MFDVFRRGHFLDLVKEKLDVDEKNHRRGGEDKENSLTLDVVLRESSIKRQKIKRLYRFYITQTTEKSTCAERQARRTKLRRRNNAKAAVLAAQLKQVALQSG